MKSGVPEEKWSKAMKEIPETGQGMEWVSVYCKSFDLRCRTGAVSRAGGGWLMTKPAGVMKQTPVANVAKVLRMSYGRNGLSRS